MARRARRSGNRRDLDAAWKAALRDLLPDFVDFAHADLHRAIDWSRPPEFLDKELQAVARRAATGRRYVDLLVKVWLRDGREEWLLIHVEVQAQYDEGFAERMFHYYALLLLRHRRPVVSLAVLIDRRPDWRLDEHQAGAWGCAVTFRYPVVKLLDWRGREEELANSDNPFAQVALAQLAVITAGGDLPALAARRRAILRQLVRAGYGEARIGAVLTFLDGAFDLPEDLMAAIDAEVAAEEGLTVTRLMTRWEERGLERGQREMLLRMIEHRWGPADAALREQLGELYGEELPALGEALLDFATLAELERWLAAHTAQPG